MNSITYNNRPFFITIILVVWSAATFGQGCSDAGFCTLGTLGQHHDDTVSGQKLTLMFPVGTGDEGVFVFTPALQYDNQLSDRWAIQAKLTANYASGNLGKASGPGDIFLSGTRSFFPERKWKTAFTLGTKLPLNLGNIKQDGKALPMQYQSSLGTIDLIAGLSLSNESWQFSFGYQQPLSGINRNNFLPAYWDTDEAAKYPPSNDFNRKGDLLARVAHLFSVKQKISIHTGLLGIYHLADDTYIDANISNDPIAINGSRGLTLNVTLAAHYKVNDRISIGFSSGAPLLFRDVRPDGLTRKFVFAPEIQWNF